MADLLAHLVVFGVLYRWCLARLSIHDAVVSLGPIRAFVCAMQTGDESVRNTLRPNPCPSFLSIDLVRNQIGFAGSIDRKDMRKPLLDQAALSPGQSTSNRP